MNTSAFAVVRIHDAYNSVETIVHCSKKCTYCSHIDWWKCLWMKLTSFTLKEGHFEVTNVNEQKQKYVAKLRICSIQIIAKSLEYYDRSKKKKKNLQFKGIIIKFVTTLFLEREGVSLFLNISIFSECLLLCYLVCCCMAMEGKKSFVSKNSDKLHNRQST